MVFFGGAGGIFVPVVYQIAIFLLTTFGILALSC